MRWLGVWPPVAALAFLIALAEGLIAYLDLPWQSQVVAHALMLGVIAAGAYFFSTFIFRVIRSQEEEILRKQQELASRQRHFRALIENSSDAIALLGVDHTIMYASPCTTRLTGYAVDELLGQSALALIHPEDLQAVSDRFAEAIQNPVRFVTSEFRFRHKDGDWRWMEAAVTNLLDDPSVRALVCNYRDTTGRKSIEEVLRSAHAQLEARVQERSAHLMRANDALRETLAKREQAEEALQASRAQLGGIIATAMDSIITIDEEQRIVLFNKAAERMFRVSAADAIGQPVQHFIPRRFQHTHRKGLHEFSLSNFEKWWVGMLGGASAVRSGGEEFPFEAAISQVEVGKRKLFTMIIHDTSAQQEAERQLRSSGEQLRALGVRLQSVREDERTRVAREVQEQLGQGLAGLKMDLAWLANRLPTDLVALADRVKCMLAAINASIHSVRRIATELRPGLLDDLGLVAAIEWQVNEFQARTHIQCHFEASPPDLAVSPQVSIALFRICQETLTNVARHANATRVSVSLQEEAGALVLRVSDNGRGITEQEISDRNSLGLFGMRERALALGGQLSLTGRAGEGTGVTVRIPLTVPSVQDGSGRPDGLAGAAP